MPVQPHYPAVLPRFLPPVLWAYLFRCHRSFRKDALSAVAHITPPLHIEGQEFIPSHGPALVLCNHYYRPGFEAYWISMSISAVLPVEIAWVMTAERRYEHIKRGWFMRPIEKIGLKAIAQVYGHFSMPAMPPHPAEAEQRAQTVRQIIHRARSAPPAVIGLAPEGRDILTGTLGEPPPGVGRLIGHCAQLGLSLYPVGIYEDPGLCLRFGPVFSLDLPPDVPPREIDSLASRQVMQRIAALLPPPLRGEF